MLHGISPVVSIQNQTCGKASKPHDLRLSSSDGALQIGIEGGIDARKRFLEVTSGDGIERGRNQWFLNSAFKSFEIHPGQGASVFGDRKSFAGGHNDDVVQMSSLEVPPETIDILCGGYLRPDGSPDTGE